MAEHSSGRSRPDEGARHAGQRLPEEVDGVLRRVDHDVQCDFWRSVCSEVSPNLICIRLKLMGRMLLNDNPDVIVSTPSRLVQLLQNNSVSLTNLSFLAIDEADLLLSYGHKDDLTRIVDPASGWVPRLGVQGCLMSATLGEEVEGVKGLILRNPVSDGLMSVRPQTDA